MSNNSTITNPWNISGNSISASQYWDNTATTIAPTHHSIQGKMLVANYVIPEYEWQSRPLDPTEIKMRLMEELTKKMFEDKNIEFTRVQDSSSFDHKFYARIYVVPDTQVRIIRELGLASGK